MSALSPAEISTGCWNEAYAEPDVPRPHYRPLLRALEGLDLPSLADDVERRMHGAGAEFSTGPLKVCPIPRLIDRDEWALLSAGLVQRVRALSAFVADAYGALEIVAAGVVPATVIEQAEGYEPSLRGRWPGTDATLGVVGLDVVRDPDGELLALEDNARTPSGFAYAAAARDAVTRALSALGVTGAGDAPVPVPIEPELVAALRATVADAAAALGADGVAGDQARPCAAVLTSGAGSPAFFEHQAAARWLDAPLVTLEQLERRGSEVWLRDGAAGRPRRVDVVYRRTDGDRLRAKGGRPTPLAELLLGPWLEGRLAIVNAFGTGVADDKLAHAYVEAMIGFYLGEQPLLKSVETLDLGDADSLERVLSDLRGYVIKPRHGHGGHGVVVCAHAREADVQRVERKLRQPGTSARYIAQPTVALSVHPALVGEQIVERHIDLRPYAFATRQGVAVVSGGLTRVALDQGALVVNSSQDGGAKDTWVLE